MSWLVNKLPNQNKRPAWQWSVESSPRVPLNLLSSTVDKAFIASLSHKFSGECLNQRRGTSLAAGGLTFAVLSWFTKLAMLDIVLFGRIRTGPFFALLRKE